MVLPKEERNRAFAADWKNNSSQRESSSWNGMKAVKEERNQVFKLTKPAYKVVCLTNGHGRGSVISSGKPVR